MSSRLLMVGLLTACGASSADSVGTTTTTGGLTNQPGGLNAPQGMREEPTRMVPGIDATARLASARCAREEACGNVGPGKAFESLDRCVNDDVAASRVELTGSTCAKGVNPYALDRCLEDLHAVQDCDATPPSCASRRLCR